jgi:hypothetical protein
MSTSQTPSPTPATHRSISSSRHWSLLKPSDATTLPHDQQATDQDAQDLTDYRGASNGYVGSAVAIPHCVV